MGEMMSMESADKSNGVLLIGCKRTRVYKIRCLKELRSSPGLKLPGLRKNLTEELCKSWDCHREPHFFY